MHKSIDESNNDITILSANVGNLDLKCRKYLNNLCLTKVEAQTKKQINFLSPDIVAFQEILSPGQCPDRDVNSQYACSDTSGLPQIRRLLGSDYSIVCDNRNQFECMGVHRRFGKFAICTEGGMCRTPRTDTPNPECDNGFTVSVATVETWSGEKFDLVNAHLQSTSKSCRITMLKQLFIGNNAMPPLIQEDKVLIVGDFNFDPWRATDESAAFWRNLLAAGWHGRSFKYHSGIAENNPPRKTSHFLWWGKTVDIVLSNFLEGVCVTLGETPGTKRLDGGHGMDHRAIYCTLRLAP